MHISLTVQLPTYLFSIKIKKMTLTFHFLGYFKWAIAYVICGPRETLITLEILYGIWNHIGDLHFLTACCLMLTIILTRLTEKTMCCL
jgi:hypothetical protein